jgi:hypothetical protein
MSRLRLTLFGVLTVAIPLLWFVGPESWRYVAIPLLMPWAGLLFGAIFNRMEQVPS